jgi:Ca2+-binding RTX toxin-like protein
MASIGWRRRCTALTAGITLLLIPGGAAFASPTPPGGPLQLATDCYGNTINSLTVLYVPPGGAPFFGTAGDDVIIGTDGYDRIYGLAGNDTICGQGEDDVIYGDGGNDEIDGMLGNDIIHGGSGDDVIHGGANHLNGFHEFLYGDLGNDALFGDGGPDVLTCGLDFVAGSGDPLDSADGGTGMHNGDPEDDSLTVVNNCAVVVNVP